MVFWKRPFYKPRSRPFLCLFLLLPIFPLLLPTLLLLRHLRLPSPPLPPNSLIIYPHQPHTPPSLPSYNSRTLLRTSSICLHPPQGPVLSLHLPSPPLFRTSPSPNFHTLHPAPFLPQTLSSSLCFFGNNSQFNTPTCPQIFYSFPNPEQPPQTFPHTPVILAPRFPFLANIYHFLTFATTLDHTISLIKSNNIVTVLVRGWEIDIAWQKAVLRVLLHPVQIRYISNRNGCFASPHGVYVLGKPGHTNSWPFLNRSAIPGTRLYVPAGAVRFKRKFWKAFGIESGDSASGSVWGLPPLKVVYSMRRGEKGRVFGKEDGEWMRGMLRNECLKWGLEYVEADPGEMEFEEQVKVFGEAGLVVGIHGANLMDACFMRGFGAMVEVLGKGAGSLCYLNGANCGLQRYEWENERDGECDNVEEEVCRRYPRHRRVVIGGERDQEGIRGAVGKAIAWISWLRARFPEGIPVAYDEKEDGYYIDE